MHYIILHSLVVCYNFQLLLPCDKELCICWNIFLQMGQCVEFHALRRTVMNSSRAQLVYRWCKQHIILIPQLNYKLFPSTTFLLLPSTFFLTLVQYKNLSSVNFVEKLVKTSTGQEKRSDVPCFTTEWILLKELQESFVMEIPTQPLQ